MVYLIICGVLLMLEVLYFGVAKRMGIVDRPNGRSSHSRVTLRGGGIVFLFGLWLWAAFFGCAYPWFLVGATLVGAVSFVDDVRSLPDSVRLVVQFVAMALMFQQFGILRWEDWWMVIVALVICVGITNAYNFMDGINGITGGYSLAVLLPLIYLNREYGFVEESLLWVVVVADLVFCLFNFRTRAKCFAGDVGSITMAFIVVFGLGLVILKTGDLAWLTMIAVYGADTILTICHRIQLHENLGQPHRKHAFQIMANELRIKHVTVSLIYMAMQLVITAGLIWLPMNHYLYMGIVVVVLAAGYLAFMRRFYGLHAASLK